VSIHEAAARREGALWVVTVDGVGVTQGRNLKQAQEVAVDLVAVMTGEDAADIVVALTPDLGEDLTGQLAESRRLSAQALQVQAAAAEATRRLVEALRKRMTGRDVAALLGVSEQRVSQLVSPQHHKGGGEVSRSTTTGNFARHTNTGRDGRMGEVVPHP